MIKTLRDDAVKSEVVKLYSQGVSGRQIAKSLGLKRSTVGGFLRKESYTDWWNEHLSIGQGKSTKDFGANILTFDIETSPLRGAIWSLWNQNISLDMIEREWYVLSYAAKWLHEDVVIYSDISETWQSEDDSDLLHGIWELLDKADIVITQNGIKFDSKKLNARFIMHGMKPPSRYRHIDTLVESKKVFAFTSHKLNWMTDKLCKKYKKLDHGKYSGYKLWEECLKGNMDAWKEMKNYNKYDVLSLEELYMNMQPWMKGHPNLNIYSSSLDFRCVCGSEDMTHNGYAFTNLSKFDKFRCDRCGAEVRGRTNLLTEDKRKSLKMNINY